MRGADTRAGNAPSNRQLALWAILAGVNLASAFVVFRLTDFRTVYDWTSAWLLDGADLYSSVRQATDYPPAAIVVLSPLATLPFTLAAWVWAIVNIALALAAAFLAARAVRADAAWRQIALLAATFVCWSATRSLLQFSLLAVVFGLAGWRFADRRPWLAGVFLGLAMIKPQVALPYCLWAVVTQRWRVVPPAVITTAILWGTYCLRVSASPVNVARDYVLTLRTMYTGPEPQTGVSELARLAPAGWADSWTLVTALVTTALIALTVVRQSARHPGDGRTRLDACGLPGTIAAAVLMTFRHLSYAFVTMLPASAFLLVGVDQVSRRWGQVLFWSLQAGLIFDVPTAYRLALSYGFSAGWAEGLFLHFDRGLLLGWTSAMLLLQWRLAPARATVLRRADRREEVGSAA
ncbi:MAG: glycosyltransferase family 87 protein [Vicinamibacterales bacterium]